MTGRRTLAIAMLLLVAQVAHVASARAEDIDPPRYALAAGRVLEYDGHEVAVTRSGRLGVDRRTAVTVARANADGSWRLVVERTSRRFTERDGEMQRHPERRTLLVVDLHPDGRMPQRAEDTLGTINRLFPRLPGGGESAWTFAAADVTNRCRTLATGDGTWSMELTPESALWRLQAFSATFALTFDRAAGIVTAVDGQNRHQDRDTRAETERLVSDRMLPPDEARALAAEIDRVVAAEARYDTARAAALATADLDTAQAALDGVLRDLEAVTATLTAPLLRAHLDGLVRRHRASAQVFAQQIAMNARLLGRPAPAWTYEDLDGRPHTLADERGRVVVLDFWYRHCGWCIRSVPQLRRLRDRVADRPVTLLGMNVDRNVDDARLVVRELDIPWRNLRADRSIAQALGVRAYPTVVILDGAGLVRHVHRGYTPDLADELERVIDRLLAEASVAPAGP